MDDAVLAAIARWPGVPAVEGWLRLDARGVWWIRLSDATDAPFDPITNPALIAFIGRNYEADADGRWFFQNGPQRVYVMLEAAPWVVRLADGAGRFVTHTEREVAPPERGHVDEEGLLYLVTPAGLAIVLDRDLPRVADDIVPPAGMDHEAFFERITTGETMTGTLYGRPLELSLLERGAMPGRYRFRR